MRLRATPAFKMWHNSKRRADRNKWEFTITVDDIVIPARCPVTHIALTVPDGKVVDSMMTLDRIDNTQGYIKGNVRVVSMKANRMKSDLSLEEAGRLLKYMGG